MRLKYVFLILFINFYENNYSFFKNRLNPQIKKQKDKSKQPYWLGLSFKGIDQFSYADRRLPLKQFAWKQLENLYFRECKFSIEVRDLKRYFLNLNYILIFLNSFLFDAFFFVVVVIKCCTYIKFD